MSVVLDYSLTPGLRRDTEQVDLAKADESSLRYQCFCGDITFTGGDADFNPAWGWVPVLDFAYVLWKAAEDAANGEAAAVSFTENEDLIHVVPTDGGAVRITADYTSAVAAVPAADLRAASDAFLTRVISDLCLAYPPLRNNTFVNAIQSEIDADPP